MEEGEPLVLEPEVRDPSPWAVLGTGAMTLPLAFGF